MPRDIRIGGRQLHVDVRGNGPAVLFIHGFPLSGAMWDPVVLGLETRYRCIVPDLRGFGRSDPAGAASMGDHAADLAVVLDDLGEKQPVVVVGMSMGGYVAFELVRRAPDRVRALVLVSTRAQADGPEGVRSRRETAARVRRSGSAVVSEAMAGSLFAPAAAPALRERWRARMSAVDPAGVIAALDGMAVRVDSFGTLAPLAVPVLILAGAEDAITPPEDAKRMQRAAAGSVLEVIADAGHMVAVEQPERVLAVLRPFLERVAGG